MSPRIKKTKNEIKSEFGTRIFGLSFFIVVIFCSFFGAYSAQAKSFTIFNSTNVNQPYFSVNGTNGYVGLGMTNPSTLLQITNNNWISSLNAAGTGVVNMFKVNASNQIEVGAPLNIGSFEFSPDSGLVSFVDMPVSATPSAGTPEGYAFKVDGDNLMTIYSEANGAGGIQNKKINFSGDVGIGLTNPGTKLDISGSLRNSLATTHSLLGGSGNVFVMADNTGTLFSTSTSSIINPIVTSASGWTASGTTVYKTDVNGNVGIGTTNPLSKLDVRTANIIPNSGLSGILHVMSTDAQGIDKGGSLSLGGYNDDAGTALRVFGTIEGRKTNGTTGNSSGYLLFQTNNAGALSERMRIDNLGNVGIGTTNPGQPLEIQVPDTAVNHGLRVSVSGAGSTGDASLELYRNSTTNSKFWYDGSAASLYIDNAYAGASGNINFRTQTAGTPINALTILGSGNVGIGTTNPGTALEVDYNAWTTFGLRLKNTYATGHTWDLGDGIDAMGTFSIYDRTATSSRFVINNSGNIGIGLTDPSTKLDISGSLRNSLATTHSLLGAAGNVVVLADNTGTLYGTPLTTFINSNSLWGGTKNGNIYNGDAGAGNVGIGTTAPNSKLDVVGTYTDVSLSATSSALANFRAAGHVQLAVNAQLASPYTISLQGKHSVSTGAAYPIALNPLGGNVGIGTTNPTETLHVVGNIKTGGYKFIQSTSGLAQFTSSGGNTYFDYDGSFYFRAVPSYATNLTVLSNGNVGIGTTTPAAKLDVSTNAIIGSSAGTGALTIGNTIANYGSTLTMLGYVNSFKNWQLSVGLNGGNFNIIPSTVDGGRTFTTPALSIDRLGNVGIGLTDPSTKLDISGSLRNSLATTHSLLGGSGNVFVMADNTGTLFSTSTSSIINPIVTSASGWTASGTTVYKTDVNGNVGIGTTNPSELFHISKSASADDATAFIENTSYGAGSNSRLLLSTKGTDGNPYQAAIVNRQTGVQAGDLIFQTVGNDRVTIQQAGNVGIGTTNPTNKLEIKGSNSGIFAAYDQNNNWKMIINLTTGTSINDKLTIGGQSGTNALNFTNGSDRKMWIENSATDVVGRVLTMAAGSTVAGTSVPDVLGGNLILQSGLGTGAGSSNILFQTGTTLTTGTTLQTMSTKMAILGNGNVGIGTSNPGDKLVVYNGAITKYTTTGIDGITDNLLKFGYYNDLESSGNGNTNRYHGIDATITAGGGNSNKMLFKLFQGGSNNIAPATVMTLQGDGNVGIGLTDPSTKLDISGSLRNSLATTHSLLGAAGNVVVLADNTGTLYGTPLTTFINSNSLWGGTKNGNIYNGDAGAGNVGIGTTQPFTKLFIRGSDSQLTLNTDTHNSGTTTLRFKLSTDPTDNQNKVAIMATAIGSYGRANLHFVLNNSADSLNATVADSRLTILSGGNVGIGTTNPTQLLNLSGATARARIDATANNGEAAFISYNDNGGWLTYSKFGSLRAGTSAGINNAGLSLFASYGSDFVIETIDNKSLIFATTDAERMRVTGTGSVGIGVTNPGTKLDISGTLRNSLATSHSLLGGSGNVVVMADNTGALFATSTAAITGSYLPLTGGALSGNLNMGGNDIVNINKLTVNTIDPLYSIKGTNYSTFAPSVVGGVKEEYIGKAEIKTKDIVSGERRFVIDFDKISEGSDLWVWYKTVDFSENNVEILITPYGEFAQVYSSIEGNKIIIHSDKQVKVSYRLSGRRHDWQKWPTKATDQKEKAGFVIE